MGLIDFQSVKNLFGLNRMGSLGLILVLKYLGKLGSHFNSYLFLAKTSKVLIEIPKKYFVNL